MKGHGQVMRVLVAEDVEDLATAIAAGLRREGMAVDVVLDGAAALDHLAITPYDVVVLDRDLPGVHGDEVCRKLAAWRSGSRVLMLTAASTVRDRVEGLGLGADDYLPKPFDFAELLARIRAIGRRPAAALPPVLEHGDLTLDPASRLAFRAGRRLDLSPKEFGVANASHEMRTPLAAEKTVLQVALADPEATTTTLRSACEKALQWNAR
jgi:DNA-binding response OmpR family regulator